MKKSCLNCILLALILPFTTGCLIMSGSSIEETGVRLSPATLGQIEPGHTTENWLLATLGEPTSRSRVDDRTDILRYTYTREKSSGGAVFLIFAGGTKTTESTVTYFEVTDGIVTRHWTEH